MLEKQKDAVRSTRYAVRIMNHVAIKNNAANRVQTNAAPVLVLINAVDTRANTIVIVPVKYLINGRNANIIYSFSFG